MDETVFWELLGRACEMGKFVVAVPNSAASANIVGRIQLGYDGEQRVLQKKKCPECHVHFKPEEITEFAFIHLDPGYGAEPCLELRSTAGRPVLRLYYRGKKAVKRYDEFMKESAHHEAYISGGWSKPREEDDDDGGLTGAAVSAPGIFVGSDAADDTSQQAS